jgi:hypothetical protein
MEKGRWTEFLASKIKSQIDLENAHKTMTVVLGLLCLIVLGFSLNAVEKMNNRVYLNTCKVMFVMLYHAVMVLGIYLPALIQKGEKAFARFFGIHDFASLVLISSSLMFYSIVVLMLGHQIAFSAKELSPSGLLTVVSWFNFVLTLIYFSGLMCFFAGLLLWPSFLTKLLDVFAKSSYALLGCHAVLFCLLGFSYTDNVKLGTPIFFEQFFVMALMWIFIVGSIHFIGRGLLGSAVPALSALELDVATGRIEKDADILGRYKNAYASERLSAWLDRVFAQSVSRAKDVARYTQDALSLVNRDKPTEIDLRQVEDRYKMAEKIYRKLEKDSYRFQITLSLIALSPVEREKTERIHDQFSRECRNAKIELASIRKRIDEKLVAIKNVVIAEAAVALPETASTTTTATVAK